MQAVILAAGESSRFWPLNSRHKCLFRLMGKSLIEWTIESAAEGGIDDIIIVEGADKPISSSLKKQKGVSVRFVGQNEPLGMADALQKSRKLVKDRFFLLHPYHFDAAGLAAILKSGRKNADAVLLGKKTARPQDYGIIRFSGGRVAEVVEKPKTKAGGIRVVGAYLLGPEIFEFMDRTDGGINSFEAALSLYAAERDVRAVVTSREIPSLKYPWDILHAARLLLKMKAKKSRIRDDIVTKHNVVVEGDVFMGKDVMIHENAVIRGPAYIGDHCVIGNNALVRNSILEAGARIGANAEAARSVFSAGCSVHSGYFGDSVFGEGCRIGAGFISANVRLDRKHVTSAVKGDKIDTGMKSLGVICGEKTAFGIGVMTMPGALIGPHSIIGPGYMVKENMPDRTRLF